MNKVNVLESGSVSAPVVLEAVLGLAEEASGLPEALNLCEKDAAPYFAQAFYKHYRAESVAGRDGPEVFWKKTDPVPFPFVWDRLVGPQL